MRHPQHLVAGRNVLVWSMCIVAFCYIFMGAAGFTTFGEQTRENIILNLPITETYVPHQHEEVQSAMSNFLNTQRI